MNSSHNTRLCIKAKAWIDGNEKTFVVKGRKAQTLLALVQARTKGITSLELSNTWAVRLSAYVFDLKQDHGLEIETAREEHTGG